MNEKNIQKLISDIIAYLKMLRKHYAVSIHGMEHLIGPYLYQFLPYNTHTSSMCVYVKQSSVKMYRSCLRCQHIAGEYARHHGDYCGTCPFGMTEYVYDVPMEDDGQHAIICISGYRLPDEQLREVVRRAAALFELDEEILFKMALMNQTERPSEKLLRTLIHPLAHMLTLLFERIKALKLNGITASYAPDALYTKALHYLDYHYRTDVSVKQLAQACHCSVSYISHMFKMKNGLSVRAYINTLRLRDAVIYLDTTALSVGEIAYMLGFSDSNYFSTVFRKQYGCAPSMYRKVHKRKS